MCRCKEAILLSGFGSNASDSAIKAVLVNFLSLFAGFPIGVVTSVMVTVSPTARLSTLQRPKKAVPWLQEEETKFSGSGIGSPKRTFVAVSGPRLVTVIVNVMFSPILTFFRSAVLVSAKSAV